MEIRVINPFYCTFALMKKIPCFWIAIFSLLMLFGYSQDRQVIDSIEMVLLQTTDVDLRVDLLLNVSDEYLTLDPDKAKIYAENALILSNKYELDKGKVLSHIDLAEIYQIKTDFKNCIEHASQAKEMAILNGFKSEFAKSALIIANSYTQLGYYTKSSDLCFEALEVYEKLENAKGTCDALNSIGIIYFQQKQYNKALEYFQKSLDIAEEMKDDRGISRGLNNISNVYGLEKENIPKNIKILIKAVKINQQTGQKLWLGINYSNLALYYSKIDEYDSSFYYIHKSINTYKELNNQMDLAEAYNQISGYYFNLENTEQFFYYLNMADSIGSKNDYLDIQLTSANLLQKYYSSIADFENAFKYKSIEFNLKDSLDNENSLTRLAKLESLYDLEKKEQERKIQAQRKDFISILIIVCLVAGLVVILLLLFRYRIKVRYSNLKQLKLEDELEFKNKEMAANVIGVMKKNDMLSDIISKLIDIENEATKDETKSSIKQIAIEIENSIQAKIWEEFEMRFKQVHSDFYDRLNQCFPDLSPNEQRLCAFLKLNLSTKEISSITGQSSRAIEMARFRLRKKLGISAQDVNLITFITGI